MSIPLLGVQACSAQLEALGEAAGLRPRKLDKKAERSLVHAHRKALQEQLQAEENPPAVLSLAVPLLFIKVGWQVLCRCPLVFMQRLHALDAHSQAHSLIEATAVLHPPPSVTYKSAGNIHLGWPKKAGAWRLRHCPWCSTEDSRDMRPDFHDWRHFAEVVTTSLGRCTKTLRVQCPQVWGTGIRRLSVIS